MSDEPPRPIPPHLRPYPDEWGAATYPGDLVFVISTDELMAIAAFIGGDMNLHPAILRLVHREGSPWIEFSAVQIDRQARAWTDELSAELLAELGGRVRRFALWRYTLAVYRIEDDGSVGDDPVWTLKGGAA